MRTKTPWFLSVLLLYTILSQCIDQMKMEELTAGENKGQLWMVEKQLQDHLPKLKVTMN